MILGSPPHTHAHTHTKPTAFDKISSRRGDALARTTSFPLSLDITGFNIMLSLFFQSLPEVYPSNKEKHQKHVTTIKLPVSAELGHGVDQHSPAKVYVQP